MKEVLPILFILLLGVLDFFSCSAATLGERSDLIEGDIYIGDKNTRSILRTLSHRRLARNALLNPLLLWPGAKVPYQFEGGVSEKTKQVVKQAIDDLEKHTCVRFVPRTNEVDHVYILSDGKACYSAIGRSRRRQKLSLGSGCAVKGIAIHELMHSIGFFHEQSRRDRNDYVTIEWDNIDPKQYRNFQKYEHGQADGQGQKYDYSSLMHYHKYAFSKNGRATIVPKQSGVYIGQRTRLSSIDIKKINKLYKCGAESTTMQTTTAATTTAATTTAATTTAEPTTVETTTVTPTTENAPTTKGQCVNRHRYCQFYAMFGYCRHRNSYYKLFMYHYCKLTCGYCKKGSVDI